MGERLKVKSVVKFIYMIYFYPAYLVNWLSDGRAWSGAWKQLRLEDPVSPGDCKD